MTAAIQIVLVLLMLAALALIPLGLPGLWLAVAILLGLVLWGKVGWTLGLVGAGAALLAEAAELAVVRRFGTRYGGSPRAFWGAIVGGMIGLFVGVPIPLIGPVVAGFAGTFAGAAAVTYWETRRVDLSTRVGWGVVVARTVAVGLKVGVGVALVAAVSVALIL